MTDIKPVARQWRGVSCILSESTSWHTVPHGDFSGWQVMEDRFPETVRVEYRSLYAEEDVQKLRDEIDRLRGDLEDA